MKNIKSIYFFIFILINCSGLIHGKVNSDSIGNSKPILDLSGVSSVNFSVKGFNGIANIKQTNFLYGKRYSRNPQNENRVVIAQEIKSEIDDNAEGIKSQLNAVGYVIKKNKSVEKAWTVNDEAYEGRLVQGNAIYQTIQKGCCSIADKYKWYNINTGALILEHTSCILAADVNNIESERFIGYKAAETFNTFDYEKEKFYVGTVTYASKDSTISKIIIKAASESDMFKYYGLGFARISFCNQDSSYQLYGAENLSLRNTKITDGKPIIGGYSIKLNFIDKDVILPIKNDDIDISSVTDNTITLRKITYRK